MGLDQYAYRAHKANAKEEWYESAHWDGEADEFVNSDSTIEKPVEIAYWRKHPNLQGWMEDLYRSREGDGDFNGDELELHLDDLIDLELAVKTESLPTTTGFFFGSPSDEHYYDEDLAFVAAARQAITDGYRVFYNSSW